MNETRFYAQMCASEFPESYSLCISMFGTQNGPQAAAECAFVFLHDQKPDWAVLLDFYNVTWDGEYYFTWANTSVN